jgi:hypothetical protein
MTRLAPLLFPLTFLAPALGGYAQTAAMDPSSTPAVDVLYVQQNANILTYDVNPQTAEAMEVGQPLVLNTSTGNIAVVPAPRDHFLNVLWVDGMNREHLWVYATDASVVPQSQPVQKLEVSSVLQFQADPNGKFDYALGHWTNWNGAYVESIRLFAVDSSTGKLTESPHVQASYGPNYYFTAGLFGFNAAGSKLYNTWNVDFDGEASSAYYARTVDPTTGTLGRNVEFFRWDDWLSSDQVLLTNNLIIDLSRPFGAPQPQSINIYPLVNNPKTPLILCNTAMLAGCGTTSGIVVDATGQYLFLSQNSYLNSSNITQVVKIG